MVIDLDTFLVALYTIVDDLSPQCPGPRPTVADSEILTLALCAQWWGGSGRAVLRYARGRTGGPISRAS